MKTENPVPVIEFSRFADGGTDAAAVREIDRACRESGFFYLQGHGIDRAALDEVWAQARWFFSLPPEARQRVARSETNSRGYYDRELTKNVRDMKEVFDFGHVPAPDLLDDHPDNHTQDGWNQWPDAPGGARFKAVMTGYFEQLSRVALRLLEVLTENLGASADALTADFYPAHSSFLRLNYYPVKDPLSATENAVRKSAESGHMGVHHHTDAGALTLLLQDEVGGLEILHGDSWWPVPPIPGTLVVNIGDIVQVWSNDQYQAPLHRVVASKTRDRYSLPFFFNPVYEANYAPLPETTGTREPPHYRPINWGHFRHERQHGDYGDYGDEIQISDFRADGA
jgi:isopenicillin N synthase-like dioxygenase